MPRKPKIIHDCGMSLEKFSEYLKRKGEIRKDVIDELFAKQEESEKVKLSLRQKFQVWLEVRKRLNIEFPKGALYSIDQNKVEPVAGGDATRWRS